MKSKYLIILIVIGVFGIFSHPIGLLLLLAERDGYIPNKSSIFSFRLTYMEEGSGGYWRTGSDGKYFYYFSPTEKYTYFYIEKDNKCPNFNEFDFETWCNPTKVYQEHSQ
ncbi:MULTISPECIES: hypothetical protein [Bacteria]|uniref:hypothetical protein n=1 Tax=Bacteria TaxID=2 RepID=UPI0025B97668|nr:MULTISPECIES: hypothetical protein [Bacteria]MCI7224242.1 hypothetical protein [Fusobacterium sp.]MDY5420986.1 hypothetical protein [Actinobacillus porcinus]